MVRASTVGVQLAFAALAIVGGCGDTRERSAAAVAPNSPADPITLAPDEAPLYFASPQQVPGTVSPLIGQGRWSMLARHYDRSLTPHVSREDMDTGRFFIDADASATQGPTAITRYKHPFPPGSVFVSAEAIGDPDILPCVWSLTTVRTIDQGGSPGTMVQRVLTECRLIQTSRGYQLLPPARVADARSSR